VVEWREYLERESGEDGEITARLEGYEELGVDLGIRAEPAAVVNGPRGTRTLQDSPDLARLERAIEAVR
jgi:protein-disulfide isomerase